jgi:hypothetical protein
MHFFDAEASCTVLRKKMQVGFCFSAPHFLKFNPNLNTSREEMAPYPS